MRTHPVIGTETINSFDRNESDEFREERAGGVVGVEYSIAFQSGAWLRFICTQLLVAVMDS
jgi:hypothetical protein